MPTRRFRETWRLSETSRSIRVAYPALDLCVLLILSVALLVAGCDATKKRKDNAGERGREAPTEKPREARAGEVPREARHGEEPREARAGEASGDKAAIAMARSLVDEIVGGKFTETEKRFDEAMKKALPAEALEKTWKPIGEALGDFQKITDAQISRKDTLVAVSLTAAFANGAIVFRVVLNQHGQVGGLFFQAPSPKGTWKPPAYADPKTFSEEEVTVGEGKWALPGTLTLPVGAAAAPVCGVVLVHGSGPHDRDETIPPNKPFKDLAWGLASRGIAVLRYEKRTLVHGAAMAKEEARVTIQEESVDDALAGARLLRARTELRPSCVVIVGHSLGGFVAPLVGKQDPGLAGLVLLAGNTRTLQTLILSQFHYLFSLDGVISEKEKAKLDELKKSLAILEDPKALAAAEKKDLPLGIPPAYWKALLDYDPAALAKTLSLPMLILQGERDYQVTMEDFAGWKKALGERKNVSFKSYPQLNHLFMAGQGRSTPAEYAAEGNVAAEVIADIVAWVAGLRSKQANP